MKRWLAEPGQAAIELAMTTILFITLVLFIMDGGRIFWNYLTVAEVAQEGARYAITHGANSTAPVGPNGYTALRDLVEARAVGLDPAHLTVTATWANDDNHRGSTVTVEVAYATGSITSLFWDGITFTLADSASMVVQN